MLSLFCGGVTTDYSTGAVPLDERGNFSVKGVDLIPIPPMPCNSPVLLVCNAAAPGAWFAAGLQAEDD
jgi:hypothetical protein